MFPHEYLHFLLKYYDTQKMKTIKFKKYKKSILLSNWTLFILYLLHIINNNIIIHNDV